MNMAGRDYLRETLTEEAYCSLYTSFHLMTVEDAKALVDEMVKAYGPVVLRRKPKTQLIQEAKDQIKDLTAHLQEEGVSEDVIRNILSGYVARLEALEKAQELIRENDVK